MSLRRLRSRSRASPGCDRESVRSGSLDSRRDDNDSAPPSSTRVRVVRRYPSRRGQRAPEPPWLVYAGGGSGNEDDKRDSESGAEELDDDEDDTSRDRDLRSSRKHAGNSRLRSSHANNRGLREAADVGQQKDDCDESSEESHGSGDERADHESDGGDTNKHDDDGIEGDDGDSANESAKHETSESESESESAGHGRNTRGVRNALAEIASRRRAQREREASRHGGRLGRGGKRSRSPATSPDRSAKLQRSTHHSRVGSVGSGEADVAPDRSCRDVEKAACGPTLRTRSSRARVDGGLVDAEGNRGASESADSADERQRHARRSLGSVRLAKGRDSGRDDASKDSGSESIEVLATSRPRRACATRRDVSRSGRYETRSSRRSRKTRSESDFEQSQEEDADYDELSESSDERPVSRSRRKSRGKRGRASKGKRRPAREKTRVARQEEDETPVPVLTPEERQARLDQLVRQSEQINAELQAAISRGRSKAARALQNGTSVNVSTAPQTGRKSSAPSKVELVEGKPCAASLVSGSPPGGGRQPSDERPREVDAGSAKSAQDPERTRSSVDVALPIALGVDKSNGTVIGTPVPKFDVVDQSDLNLPIAKGRALQPHQAAGVKWLLQLDEGGYNGILADEMGLGKTVQALSVLASVITVGKRGPHLIIAPLAVAHHWVDEAERWFPSVMKAYLHCGTAPDRLYRLHEALNDDDFDLFVTSYDIALRDIFGPMPSAISGAGGFRSTLRRLRNLEFEYLIVDEAHRLKNPAAKLTVALRKYRRAGRRILLTGTPLSNKLDELWALLNVLNPTIFDSSDTFQSWFSSPFEDGISLSNSEKAIIVARMHTVLRPFFRRRVRSDVCEDFTHADEIIVQCPPSPLQVALQRYYQKVRRGFTTDKVRGIMTELRKCASHPWVVSGAFQDEHLLENERPLVASSGKFLFLHYALPRLLAADHRVLIFGQLKMTLDYIGDMLAHMNIPFFRLDGDTPGEDRGPMLAAFNKDDADTNIFLLSTRAGGVGLNLQSADTVILVESDWNPSSDLQAVSRIQRIGQKRTVHILRLVTHRQIDEVIVKRARKKLHTQAVAVGAGKFASGHEDDVTLRQRDIEALLTQLDGEAPLFAGRNEIDGSDGAAIVNGATPVPHFSNVVDQCAVGPVLSLQQQAAQRIQLSGIATCYQQPLAHQVQAMLTAQLAASHSGPHVAHAYPSFQPSFMVPVPCQGTQPSDTQGIAPANGFGHSGQPHAGRSTYQSLPQVPPESAGVHATRPNGVDMAQAPPVSSAGLDVKPHPSVSQGVLQPPVSQPCSFPPRQQRSGDVPVCTGNGRSLPQLSMPSTEIRLQPPFPGNQAVNAPATRASAVSTLQQSNIPLNPHVAPVPTSGVNRPCIPHPHQELNPTPPTPQTYSQAPLQHALISPSGAISGAQMAVAGQCMNPTTSSGLLACQENGVVAPSEAPAGKTQTASSGSGRTSNLNVCPQSQNISLVGSGQPAPVSGSNAHAVSGLRGPEGGVGLGIPARGAAGDISAAARSCGPKVGLSQAYVMNVEPVDTSSLVQPKPGEDGASLMRRYAEAWDPLLLRKGESSLPDIDHAVLPLADPDTVPSWLTDNSCLNYVYKALLASDPRRAAEVVAAGDDAVIAEGETRSGRARRRTRFEASLRELDSESDWTDRSSDSEESSEASPRKDHGLRSRSKKVVVLSSDEEEEYRPSQDVSSDDSEASLDRENETGVPPKNAEGLAGEEAISTGAEENTPTLHSLVEESSAEKIPLTPESKSGFPDSSEEPDSPRGNADCGTCDGPKCSVDTTPAATRGKTSNGSKGGPGTTKVASCPEDASPARKSPPAQGVTSAELKGSSRRRASPSYISAAEGSRQPTANLRSTGPGDEELIDLTVSSDHAELSRLPVTPRKTAVSGKSSSSSRMVELAFAANSKSSRRPSPAEPVAQVAGEVAPAASSPVGRKRGTGDTSNGSSRRNGRRKDQSPSPSTSEYHPDRSAHEAEPMPPPRGGRQSFLAHSLTAPRDNGRHRETRRSSQPLAFWQTRHSARHASPRPRVTSEPDDFLCALSSAPLFRSPTHGSSGSASPTSPERQKNATRLLRVAPGPRRLNRSSRAEAAAGTRVGSRNEDALMTEVADDGTEVIILD